MKPKKSLGQHWLTDLDSLGAVIDAAAVTSIDVVLEVGPGLGSLTKLLVARAKQVIAIETDAEVIGFLRVGLDAVQNLDIIHGDILKFDLSSLPQNYKVVANIPYYLTSALLRLLLESPNPPSHMALLVQKEVGLRVTAIPGQMSILAFSVQYYAQAKLGIVVSKDKFDPPPKVDSVVLGITLRPKPAFPADRAKLFRLVKAGFGERRKQLKNSLSGGLHVSTGEVEAKLRSVDIAPSARAQELSLDDWQKLYTAFDPVL